MKTVCPHIVVGTPGRILALVRNKKLNLKHLKHFILDECDKMLELLGVLQTTLANLFKIIFYREKNLRMMYETVLVLL